MKRTFTSMIGLLVAALILAALPTEADAAIYKDTVRLHILAPSDSEEDQALKLALRDALLEKYSIALSRSESSEEAKLEVYRMLPEIEAFTNEALRELGYEGGATVELIDEWYDRREYDGFTLPGGVYTSLKIVIGEGEGKNWWCVMYPPMCLGASTAKGGYTSEEEALISKSGYVVKSKLLELVSSISKRR